MLLSTLGVAVGMLLAMPVGRGLPSFAEVACISGKILAMPVGRLLLLPAAEVDWTVGMLSSILEEVAFSISTLLEVCTLATSAVVVRSICLPESIAVGDGFCMLVLAPASAPSVCLLPPCLWPRNPRR